MRTRTATRTKICCAAISLFTVRSALKTRTEIDRYEEHSRHSGTYKKKANKPKLEYSFIKVNIQVSIHNNKKLFSNRRIGIGATARAATGSSTANYTHCSLKGYIQWGHYPVLGGNNACQHCFCSPHIIQNPPAFLLRCTATHLANNSKQFELYRKFWKRLRDIGL